MLLEKAGLCAYSAWLSPRGSLREAWTLRLEVRLLLVFAAGGSLYSPPMSIRKAGGDWEPMLLPIEPRYCTVCKQGLYRDKTMLRGGWSRCTVCDEFVHYSCLASGKFSFLKARPRVCKSCRAAQAPVSHQVDSAVAVSS